MDGKLRGQNPTFISSVFCMLLAMIKTMMENAGLKFGYRAVLASQSR